MKFMIDELIGHPTKKRKSQKRKRDSSKAEAKKKGVAVIEEALTFLEGVSEEVLGLPTIELEVGDPIQGMEVTPPAPTDVEIVEMAPAVALLTLPTVMEEEEVQVAGLPMLALPVEPVIIEVTGEEGPIMPCLPMTEAMAEALSVIAELPTNETVREIAGEATGEVADACEAAVGTPVVVSPAAGHLVGIFLMVIVGSSSQLCGSPSRAS